MCPAGADPCAICPALLDGTMTDALVAVLLARVRSLKALVETHENGIEPLSATALLHARLVAAETRLQARSRPGDEGTGEAEVFYLD